MRRGINICRLPFPFDSPLAPVVVVGGRDVFAEVAEGVVDLGADLQDVTHGVDSNSWANTQFG